METWLGGYWWEEAGASAPRLAPDSSPRGHSSPAYTLSAFFPPVGFSLMSISTTAHYLEEVQCSTWHDCGSKRHHFMEGALVGEAKCMGITLAGPLTRAVNGSPSNALSSEVGRVFPA